MSIIYVYWLTRNLATDDRNEFRADDSYALTEEESDRLTPIARRLLEKVPGGQGVRAAVVAAEQLGLVLLLIDYADRTAPLRAAARQQGGGPARRLPRRRMPAPPSPRPAGPQQMPAQHQGAPQHEQPIEGTGEPTFRPAVAPGVLGSQYRAG